MMTLMTVMTLTVVMMMRVFTWKVCQDDQHSSTRRMTIMTGLSSLSPPTPFTLLQSGERWDCSPLVPLAESGCVGDGERENLISAGETRELSITNGKHVTPSHSCQKQNESQLLTRDRAEKMKKYIWTRRYTAEHGWKNCPFCEDSSQTDIDKL